MNLKHYFLDYGKGGVNMPDVKLDKEQQFGEFINNNDVLECGRGIFPIVPEVKTRFITGGDNNVCKTSND